MAEIVTPGFNPHHSEAGYICDCLTVAFAYFSDCGLPAPERIGYFGAGCGSEKMCDLIKGYITTGIRPYTAGSPVRVEAGSDMVLACKGVAGACKCLMVILGTGSNTVAWDGSTVAAHVPPLGYLLGDEGSGATIGKSILADVIRDMAPHEISEAVLAGRTRADLQAEIYRSPTPAAMMADVVKTATGVSGDTAAEYINKAARAALSDFFEKIVDTYPRDCYAGKLCLTGSIAVLFRQIIEELADKRGLTVLTAVQRPLEAFIDSLKK